MLGFCFFFPSSCPSQFIEKSVNTTYVINQVSILLESIMETLFSSVQWLSHVWLFATPWTAAARPPCPSPTSGVHSNSCPWNQWCHPNISSSVIPFSCPQSFPASGSFPESALHIRWPKYWSFSFNISPSSEYSGLIFTMDWLDLLTFQGTQKSSPTPQFKSINSLALSFLYSPTLTSTHDYWKNHSLD